MGHVDNISFSCAVFDNGGLSGRDEDIMVVEEIEVLEVEIELGAFGFSIIGSAIWVLLNFLTGFLEFLFSRLIFPLPSSFPVILLVTKLSLSACGRPPRQLLVEEGVDGL
jgi:hypothetical protein